MTTDHDARVVPPPVEVTGPAEPPEPTRTEGSRLSAAWTAAVGAVVVLVLLIDFMLQNGGKVTIRFLGLSGRVGLGLALLVAAAGGAALIALLGLARMLQLRLRSRRLRKAHP